MASKKLKKAIVAGFGAAALAKGLSQKSQMAEYLKTEGGDKAKVNYITKKAKPNMGSFGDRVKAATKKIIKQNINLGPGPGIKKTDTLAGMGKDSFGLGDMDGAKAGKMIKARGGKLVNLKPTKLY